MPLRYLIPLTIALIACLISCENDEITTDSSARISFSTDTLSFDTVFTSIGTATKRFMIYNKNDQPLVISSVQLAGGANSPFVVNVDGISMKDQNVTDIRIEAKDSTYVFVQAKIDPTSVNSPLLIEDSLILLSNENKYIVNFRAFGQDVHLLKDSTLKTQTWINDKPYLILGDIQVDTGQTLTIEAGARIFLHRKSWIIVDGTINVNGTRENPVIFRGDRLDKANYSPAIPYDNIPGQWGEIWLRNTSQNNKFEYAYIRNAEFGLVVGMIKEPGQATVELNNCKFENFSACALYGNNGKVKASNCIFANSGYVNFSTSTGGDYEFYHCTFANYLALGAKDGVGIYLRNFITLPNDSLEDVNDTISGDLVKATFGNCIVYGDVEDQFVYRSNSTNKMEYKFDHCLIKGNTQNLDVTDTKHFVKTKVSKEALEIFSKIDKTKYIYDWTIVRKSAARDIGSKEIATEFPYDFNSKSRTSDDAPDAGAFEYAAE